MFNSESNYVELILACEDFSKEDFEKYHCFYKYEENIIAQLMAHGPVLLKGGRGTGKSALMIEANRRLMDNERVCGIYLSLRHLSLLRSRGETYEKEFLRILNDVVKKTAQDRYSYDFSCELELYDVQKEIIKFSEHIGKRLVLFFDDAAHIGRETGLEEHLLLSGPTIRETVSTDSHRVYYLHIAVLSSIPVHCLFQVQDNGRLCFRESIALNSTALRRRQFHIDSIIIQKNLIIAR